jgi:hypothetical protein
MKPTSRNFSITRTGLIGMPLMAATLLASQVGWAQPPPKETGNMIFFRGGYTELLEDRAFNSFTDTHVIAGLGPSNPGDGGWYVGAGFDFLLTRDLWGMAPSTWALAELGLEWKKYESQDALTVVPFAECILGSLALAGVGPSPNLAGPTNNAVTNSAINCSAAARGDIELSMLTISASPKIKFMEGSRIRPWIIPAGLDFHVISPPSDAATVLDLGVQFAGGVEFELIHGIKLGVDGRYHYAADFTKANEGLTFQQRQVLNQAGLILDSNQNNDNWVVGGYLGIGF